VHCSESDYSMREGVASWIALLTWWDPAVAETDDIRTDWADCVDTTGATYQNSNDCAVHRNNYFGMWEFIDTSTENADDGYADYIDVTVEDMFDAMLTHKNTPGQDGENRTGKELYYVPTGVDCLTSEDCSAGEVCLKDGECNGGDPHGCNLRDWIHHLAANMGQSVATYWMTLTSSPCVSPWDHSYPFLGGYRYD